MILFAHRGNITGKRPELENTESYITDAIRSSYKVEIDVWYVNNKLYLGHDDPIHRTSIDFLQEHTSELLIHCRNLTTLEFFATHKYNSIFRYFYHTVEKCVLSSYGDIIMHSHANRCVANSIYMLPEILNIEDRYLINCSGICSDVISNYTHLTHLTAYD